MTDQGPESSRTTESGLPLRRCYGPAHSADEEPDRIGAPGEFPYTRGPYASMYRGRLWTMRQYAGFGSARETNQRYRYLLEQGTTGLSVAFDLPTQMGYDSDHALAVGEVGRVGVAVDSLDDIRILFEGIDLAEVSVSMTINSTAAILLAFLTALADERDIPRSVLRGTIQNDILKEYIARGTYIYPVEPSLRLVGDVMAFGASDIPAWNPISISGYHIREAGSTAPQEIAFTLANGLEYVSRALGAGLELETFAPRLSFFFAAHNDFLEEIAKYRAARRMWARLMRDRYSASDASCRLRFHTQTGGSTLTAQQPTNNIVRVALQALAAVLGGTQSLHTNGFDEALGLPTEDSARVALRTQQILAFESGVTGTVDPLGGSWAIEALTDQLEEEAMDYIVRIDDLGGAAQAVEFMRDEIQRAAYETQLAIESGERTVVGVNRFADGDAEIEFTNPDYGILEVEQCDRLTALRNTRDAEAVDDALRAVQGAARSGENLLPPIIRAARASVTLGEISQLLREEWGEYEGPH